MLKDRSTNKELFVVIFTLVPKDQAENAEDQEQAQKDEKNASGAGGKEVKAAGGDEDLD